jgi:uncharacterized membrane protein YfcA
MIFLTLIIFITSFISGIFGMAGGMILLGILLFTNEDVASVMILFGIVQGSANLWRSILWIKFIKSGILMKHIFGSIFGFVLFSQIIVIIPHAYLIYILLGMISILNDNLPKKFILNITKPFMAFSSGFTLMLLQIFAGVSGTLLDSFFQKSDLDRKSIVATKAAISFSLHILRTIYFYLAGNISGETFSFQNIYAIGAFTAIVSTSLASVVLHKMTNHGFKRWSKLIIRIISLFYIIYGSYLLVKAYL